MASLEEPTAPLQWRLPPTTAIVQGHCTYTCRNTARQVASLLEIRPQMMTPPFAILGPSFFGQATALGDGTRVLISGGFGNLSLNPVDHLSLFDERLIAVLRPANDTSELTLTQPRAGQSVVNLGNGQLLISGGISTTADNGSSDIAATATIYTDEKEVLP